MPFCCKFIAHDKDAAVSQKTFFTMFNNLNIMDPKLWKPLQDFITPHKLQTSRTYNQQRPILLKNEGYTKSLYSLAHTHFISKQESSCTFDPKFDAFCLKWKKLVSEVIWQVKKWFFMFFTFLLCFVKGVLIDFTLFQLFLWFLHHRLFFPLFSIENLGIYDFKHEFWDTH